MRGLLLATLVACGGDDGNPEPTSTDPTSDSGATEIVLALADAGPDRVVSLGEQVRFDGGSEGVSFLWDMGDGTQLTDLAPTHAWSEPGTYTVVVRATGEDGGTDADDAKVVVRPDVAEVPAVGSSTVVLADGWLYVVEPDAGTLLRTDGTDHQRVVACDHPRTVAVDGSTVAVACEGSGSVAFFTASDLGFVGEASLGVGARPYGVVSGGEGRFWVSDAGRDALVELVDGEVVATTPTDDPRHLLAVDGDVLAPRWRSTDDVGRLHRTVAADVELPYDPGPDTDTSIRGVPHLFGAMSASPDAAVAFVPGLLANTARGLWRDGQVLSHETTIHAALFAVDLATGEELYRKQFDDQGEAGAVVTSPYGETAFVAFPGTQTILALDAWDGDIIGSILSAGHDITGLAHSATGTTLYVHASLDRELRAYDVASLTPEPELLWSVSTVDVEPLSAEVLAGKRLFHDAADLRMAKDGYIRCATCHPDGGQDGLVWDFTDRGEGLRNTIDLRGKAGMAMGPLHWSANFDEVQDFEHDLRGPFGGLGLLDDGDWALTDTPLGAPKAGLSPDLDALAAYVSSLDVPVPPVAPLPKGGAEAFESAGCAECHPAPLYTDSPDALRHDVGTLLPSSGQRLGGVLDGLDTPTLLGVGHSGPWLHDGRAATLEEALEAHADGVSSPLLVDFLEAL